MSLHWIEKCPFPQTRWWLLRSLRPSDYCWIFKWAIHQAAEHLLSLLSFTGSQCDVQLFWNLLLLLLHNCEGGGLAFLNRKRACNAFGSNRPGIPPVQSLRKNPCHDGKRKREHCTALSLTLGTVHSATPSMTVTYWPQTLVFSIVLGATASLKHSLCLCNM